MAEARITAVLAQVPAFLQNQSQTWGARERTLLPDTCRFLNDAVVNIVHSLWLPERALDAAAKHLRTAHDVRDDAVIARVVEGASTILFATLNVVLSRDRPLAPPERLAALLEQIRGTATKTKRHKRLQHSGRRRHASM